MSYGVQGMSSSTLSQTTSSAASSSASATGIGQSAEDPLLDPNGPFANLDLTAAQQQQITQILSQSSGATASSPTQLFNQVESVLTPQQQQKLQADLETSGSHHHHHHPSGDGSTSATDPLAQLDLTSDQKTQISQLVQSAQSNGTSSSALLTQIDAVLTPSQQAQLASSLGAYASTGSTTQSTQGYVVNTNA